MPSIVPTGFLARLLHPVRDLRDNPAAFQRTLARMGIRAPLTAAELGALSWANALIETIDTIDDAVQTAQHAAPAGNVVATLLHAADELGGLLAELQATPSDPDFFDADVMARIAAELPGLLLAEAIVTSPGPAAIARLLGLLHTERVAVDADGPAWQQPAQRYRFDLTELPAVVTDPVGRVRDRWGWRPGAVNADVILADLVDVTRLLGWPARKERIPEVAAGLVPSASRWRRRAAVLPIYSGLVDGETRFVETGLVVSPIEDPDGSDSGLYVGLLSDYPATHALRLDRDWTIDAAAVAPAGLALTPGGTELITGNPAESIALTVRSEAERHFALGLANVTVPGLALAIEISPAPQPSIAVRLSTADDLPLTLVLDPTFGSNFLREIVGGPFEFEVGLDVGWSSATGFSLGTAIGFDVLLPLGLRLGVITLDSLALALEPGGDGAQLSARLAASAAIGGTVAMSVEGIGVALALTPSNGLLPAIGVDVLPPTGIGFGIQTDVASGGGFLYFDPANGEYGGVVDIEVLGVGISAVVIIETEAPGVDGWSMFFALFIELPSIQLGFGFTLTGVGGVAGINRTLDPEALGSAVRSGSLDAVLFPEKAIEEAPLIIDTFKAIFPAANDRVVFGPIVRIGWGTPTLVEAELGIVLALPDPVIIAVLGSVTAILPTPDVDLVAINLDIGGVIDFEAQSLTLSASLHDSHVVGFALSGDMELRANFGGRPEFLMSLGGFHPDFVPPAGFPALRRLRLALNPSPILEVSFECYLALTSNSVQFGAALDLAAEIAGFGIEGGASFDAMVQFSPFLLSTSLGFYITIKAAGVELAGVWLDIAVKGPNPWAIDGVARFKLLGFEEQIDVHEIIGTPRDEPAIEPAEIRGALVDTLSLPESWTVVGSPAGQGVTLASEPALDGRQLASPESTLAVAQQLVPFGLDLAHVGDAPLGEFRRFELEALPGGTSATGTTVDWFAPAMFFDLSPVEAVSGPSFEELANGITLGGGEPTAPKAIAGSLEYEQILRDPEMGIERLDLDSYEPLADDRPLLATAHSQTLAIGSPYTATVDDPKQLGGTVYALVDPATGDELARHTSWSAAHTAPRSTAAASAVVAPTWELAAS